MEPASLNLTTQVIGHQYCCFVTPGRDAIVAPLAAQLDALCAGLHGLHDGSGQPDAAARDRGCFQWLRGVPERLSPRDLVHPGIAGARALLRLEASAFSVIEGVDRALRALIGAHGGSVETIGGVQRPRSYTSHAMQQYAYAPALAPQPAAAHPWGVVTPMNKTAAWWAMPWIQRESFFLPRYDADDRMTVPGHTLASADAVPTVVRRLVHAPERYGQSGRYDFVGYFEFADAHADVFTRVMANLRDRAQNPEWKYVEEGPEWWGRRVATAREALQ